MTSYEDVYDAIHDAIEMIQLAKRLIKDAATRAILTDIQTWLDDEREAIVVRNLENSNGRYKRITGQMGQVKDDIARVQADTQNFVDLAETGAKIAAALAKVAALV